MDIDTADERPLFIGALIAAALIALAGLFGPHDGSVLRLPRVLQGEVERALASGQFSGLEVRMDGQTARLEGVAPDEASLASLQRAALTAAGAGGAWAGGVTGVDLRGVTIGAVEQPFEWRITRRDGQVTLEGAAPSEAAKAALLQRARATFPNGEIIDRMHVAGGAPSPAWRRVALGAIDQLGRLASGEARLSDARLVVLGEGERQAVAAVRGYYQNPPPAPFRARADVTVTGDPLAIPELADLDLTAGRADVCAQAFDRLMAQNVINFASGSADLDRASLPLLDNLASVALRCDAFEIEVAGHTDDQGPREANLDLSRRRAETVVAYLANLNVARARLHAVGYGPDRPVASNATPSGQAANRRIVFTVRG